MLAHSPARTVLIATASALLVSLIVSATTAAEFDSAGVKIFYTEQGAGPPVVLVHGYLASGALNWGVPGVSKLLAPDYRLIVLDNRGHGNSDKPRDVAEYGETMAEDVVRLLDHLKISKAHVVGYSMGGMITLKLLAKHPDRLLSGVVAGMGWREPGIVGGFLAEAGEKLTDLEPRRACALGFPQLGITREELAGIKTPMTMVIGANDGLKRGVDNLSAVRADVPVVVVPEANHMTCIFKPEFRDAIKEFLDRQPKP